MKTNRFEEILRRKLESIQPDFQDQDWDKWQSFKQLHSPPSFWQSYGHWLGYAVGTLCTAVMVALYINQSSQNDTLMQELKSLKQQMAVQPNAQSVVTPDSGGYTGAEPRQGVPIAGGPDTVYIIKRQTMYREVPSRTIPEQSSSDLIATQLSQDTQPVTTDTKPDQTLESTAVVENKTSTKESKSKEETESTLPEATPSLDDMDKRILAPVSNPEKNRPVPTPTAPIDKKDVALNTKPHSTGNRSNEAVNPQSGSPTSESTPTGTNIRTELGEVVPLATKQEFANSRNHLYRRLRGRMPQSARAVSSTPSIAEAGRVKDGSNIQVEEKAAGRKTVDRKSGESKSVQEKASADKKMQEVTKEESLLPKFGLNLPFRVGAGQQWAGKSKAFSLWNEVLIGSNWGIQAGVSWTTLEVQKFVTEKKFKDDTRQDFRKQHAKRLPPNFHIFNITTQTTLLQVPLGVTYRGNLGTNFTYLIGAGTSLNIRAKQVLMFDFERPTQDYGQQGAVQYIPLPVINNAQLSAGLEKRWSPIVVQVGTFVETRAKTFPFLKDRTQVGLRVKLLYEFGSAKKK